MVFLWRSQAERRVVVVVQALLYKGVPFEPTSTNHSHLLELPLGHRLFALQHAICAVATLASGYASAEEVLLKPDAASVLNGKTIVQTMRTAPPVFEARTIDRIQRKLTVSAPEIITSNQVDDPAHAIGAGLIEKLQAARGMQVAAPATAVTAGDVDNVILASRGKSAYLLDVQTDRWLMNYYPLHWGRLRVFYRADARLIDAATRKTVSTAACRFQSDAPTMKAPTFDQLVSDGAAGLKAELAKAVSHCITSMAADMQIL